MYIPPNQYETGFYSNGEYYLNRKSYFGPYWKLKDGQVYSGESPNEDSLEIFKDLTPNNNTILLESDLINTNSSYIKPLDYNPIINNQVRAIPRAYKPSVQPENIKSGIMKRFFVKRVDQFLYFEINPFDYYLLDKKSKKIAWDLYSVISIDWIIKGDVFNIIKNNKESILNVEDVYSQKNQKGKDWKGFSQLFKGNYLEFYQKPDESQSINSNQPTQTINPLINQSSFTSPSSPTSFNGGGY